MKMEKTKSLEELQNIVIGLRKNKKKIVFTNGCFDLLHLGHVRSLRKAKSLGDVLIVGINSDRSVRKLKGVKRPLFSEKERAEVLSSLECIDFITVFKEATPGRVISLLKPDIHVKSSDYRAEELPEKKIVESYGGKVVITEEVKGISTTRLIQKILKHYS